MGREVIYAFKHADFINQQNVFFFLFLNKYLESIFGMRTLMVNQRD